MGPRQELEAYRGIAEAGYALTRGKAKGPLGIVGKAIARIGAEATTPIIYVSRRLVSGESPEEIIKESKEQIENAKKYLWGEE